MSELYIQILFMAQTSHSPRRGWQDLGSKASVASKGQEPPLPPTEELPESLTTPVSQGGFCARLHGPSAKFPLLRLPTKLPKTLG